MKGKKALALVKIVAYVISISAALVFLGVIIFGLKPVDMAKGLLESIPITQAEQVKCVNKEPKGAYFWCKNGKNNKPECVERGDAGIQGQSCDPEGYKPVNYQKGSYDVCTQKCKVEYCPSGEGRISRTECGECSNAGESCEGPGGKGCCAPDKVECKDKFAVFGSGTCKPKANIKATGLTTPTQGSW